MQHIAVAFLYFHEKNKTVAVNHIQNIIHPVARTEYFLTMATTNSKTKSVQFMPLEKIHLHLLFITSFTKNQPVS